MTKTSSENWLEEINAQHDTKEPRFLTFSLYFSEYLTVCHSDYFTKILLFEESNILH